MMFLLYEYRVELAVPCYVGFFEKAPYLILTMRCKIITNLIFFEKEEFPWNLTYFDLRPLYLL